MGEHHQVLRGAGKTLCVSPKPERGKRKCVQNCERGFGKVPNWLAFPIKDRPHSGWKTSLLWGSPF